jgi:hypothetical protein
MGTHIGENLTGLDFVALVIPVSVVLFSWIGIMFWADLHPEVRHVGSPPPASGSINEPLTPRGQAATSSTLASGAADEEPAAEQAARPGGTAEAPQATPAEEPTTPPEHA